MINNIAQEGEVSLVNQRVALEWMGHVQTECQNAREKETDSNEDLNSANFLTI